LASAGQGLGSEFVVSLPALTERATAAALGVAQPLADPDPVAS
jgi:hypothetical protein